MSDTRHDSETPRSSVPEESEAIVEKVRERYGGIAEGKSSGCCSPSAETPDVECCVAERIGYDSNQLEELPDGANMGLGCGAPIGFLCPAPGEVVLDLGSGGGLDALIAAPQVLPGGRVIGVDMTPEMIDKARANAASVGHDHVEFRHGRLEELPVDDASVDAVTSNCVINLVPDKAAVFREVARVLKPGGRLVISDIVLDGKLPEALEKDLMAYVGCVAGAMQRESYFGHLAEAGLTEIEIHRDVDYLATVDGLLPDEVSELLDRTGLAVDSIRGVVRSVTYRASKPR